MTNLSQQIKILEHELKMVKEANINWSKLNDRNIATINMLQEKIASFEREKATILEMLQKESVRRQRT